MKIKLLIPIIFLFLSSMSFAQEQPVIPGEVGKDFCARDDSKFAHTIIIIDVSSKLDQAQLDYIKGKVFTKNFYLSYSPFTKFSYLLINNNKKPQSQNFIFSMCRPKSGTKTRFGALDLNNDSENKVIVKKYFTKFMKKAESASEELGNYYDASVPNNKQKSYIYETIAAVFDMSKFDFELGSYGGYKRGTRDLIVISDMMQHTARLSFYEKCKPYALTKAKCPTYKSLIKETTTRDYIQKTSPKNPSSSIQLYFLTHRNETTIDLDTSLERLWNQYLISAGFSSINFERQLDIQ